MIALLPSDVGCRYELCHQAHEAGLSLVKGRLSPTVSGWCGFLVEVAVDRGAGHAEFGRLSG
jgi:hypothetical protein